MRYQLKNNEWKRVYLAFGANWGTPQQNIEKGLTLMRHTPRMKLVRVSPLYRTSPVGGPKQPPFLNGVVVLQTTLPPRTLFRLLKQYERHAGARPTRMKWGPRPLDLDILMYADLVIRGKRLTIPHPRYHARRFVLAPLVRVAPQVRHPIFKKTTRQLLRELTAPDQRVTMVATWHNTQFLPFKRRKKTKSQ